jgi:hypothetical protein
VEFVAEGFVFRRHLSMNKFWLARFAAALAALAVLLGALAACSIFREASPTPRPTTVASVTANQVAQAMDNDEFYSTYGHTTLLIQGTVAALDPQPGHFTVTLDTGVRTKVLCDLGQQTAPVKVGDSITVRSADPENDVQRQNASVFIKNCTLP